MLSTTNLPRFVAGISLALAIAATALVFDAVWVLVLRPLPYKQPGRLVEIWNMMPGFPEGPLGYAEYRALEKESAFASVSALAQFTNEVSPNLFRVLGASPMLGRDFEASDVGGPACIASYSLWKNELGGDPKRLGTFIAWGSKKCQLIGVMPTGFRFGYGLDVFGASQFEQVWYPSRFPTEQASAGTMDLFVIARLAPGASRSQSSAALGVLSASLTRQQSYGFRMYLLPITSEVTAKSAAVFVPLLLSALALLILTAANLACFTSLRVRSRLRSLAIRAALGAGQRDLLVAALREPLLDVGISAVVGFLLGWWALRILPSRVALPLPRWYSVAMDWRVAAFVGVCALAVFAFAAVPAILLLRRSDLSSALKPSGVQTPSPVGRTPDRQPLSAAVAFQFAVTLALLSGIGAMFFTLRALLRPANLGFNPNGLVSLYVGGENTASGSETLAWTESAVKALPGVQSVAVASGAPLSGDSPTGNVGFSVAGKTGTTPGVTQQLASPEYFRTLGVPIVQGRPFEASDNAQSAPVAIVNETFVRSFLGGMNPLSARIESANGNGWASVVGVAGDVRESSALDSAPQPEVYAPASQTSDFEPTLLVRTSRPADVMLRELEGAVRVAMPSTHFYREQSAEAAVRKAAATRRFTLWALAAFGLTALLVAAAGLYSIIGHLANQSLHAYAVRMALGSTPGGILALVMKRAAAIAGTGIALGLLGAWGVGHILRSLLYGVAPTDPAILAAAVGALTLASFLAAYPTARAAAKIDPARLLRGE